MVTHAGTHGPAQPVTSPIISEHVYRESRRITARVSLPSHRPTGGGARIRRLLARFVGAAFVAFLAVTIAESGRPAAPTASWWSPIAAVIVIGPGLVLFALTFGTGPGSERWIRAAAIAAAVGYAAAMVGWLLAWTGETVSGVSSSWLLPFSGLIGLCAALVWRPGRVAAVQVITTACSSMINQMALTSPQLLWQRVGAETVWALGFSGIFVAAAIMAMHTSRILDATEETAAEDAAGDAARTARARERTKFDALVHDQVIAVLLEAGRTDAPQHLPAHARSALHALDALTAPTHPTVPHKLGAPCRGAGAVSAREVVERLDTHLTGIESAVSISVGGIDDLGQTYPVDALSAITAAAAEATRNSLLHAGINALPSVTLDITAEQIRVVVSDAGKGFDPLTVQPGRLGVTGSIDGRMREIPGGRSHIVTGVGAGTSVELIWTRPAADTNDVAPEPSREQQAEGRRHSRENVSGIVGVRTRWAMIVAAGFLACAAVAAANSVHVGMAPGPAAGSLILIALGIGVVAAAGNDPIGHAAAAVCAGIAPLLIVVAALGVHEPVADPLRSAAAVSGGLVVCAFLCVRGRARWAWLGYLAACAVYAAWSIDTGHGLLPAVQVLIPGVGVMIVASVFTALLRPAVNDIYALRAEHAHRQARYAAENATQEERRHQSERLDRLARPTLERITQHPELSAADRHHAILLEARLRDNIRAAILDTPALTAAVWNARTRGMTVTLLDNGGLDNAEPDIVARLQHSITDLVNAADAGTMTIRIAPPQRTHLATLTIHGGSTSGSVRYEFDHTAAVISPSSTEPPTAPTS